MGGYRSTWASFVCFISNDILRVSGMKMLKKVVKDSYEWVIIALVSVALACLTYV